MRTALKGKGVEISGGYTTEGWGNTTGGLMQEAVYTGLFDFGVTVDLEKLVGWRGASVRTTWLWLSGRDDSEDLVGNFLIISNIAGLNICGC
jgi:porin